MNYPRSLNERKREQFFFFISMKKRLNEKCRYILERSNKIVDVVSSWYQFERDLVTLRSRVGRDNSCKEPAMTQTPPKYCRLLGLWRESVDSGRALSWRGGHDASFLREHRSVHNLSRMFSPFCFCVSRKSVNLKKFGLGKHTYDGYDL